jgi:predicted  nucleic acid-binding Zn-ribbon protein
LLETLKKLEQVQELDIQIDSAQRRRAEFPARVKKFNDDIASIQVKLTEKKKLIDELEKNKR